MSEMKDEENVEEVDVWVNLTKTSVTELVMKLKEHAPAAVAWIKREAKVRSPYEQMVDAAVVCTICGKPPGCDCWVTLICKKCGATTAIQREPVFEDYKEIECLCPKCSRKNKK